MLETTTIDCVELNRILKDAGQSHRITTTTSNSISRTNSEPAVPTPLEVDGHES